MDCIVSVAVDCPPHAERTSAVAIMERTFFFILYTHFSVNSGPFPGPVLYITLRRRRVKRKMERKRKKMEWGNWGNGEKVKMEWWKRKKMKMECTERKKPEPESSGRMKNKRKKSYSRKPPPEKNGPN